jgi:hypothetical protein
MGKKKETIEFLAEISEFEDRFERIGKEVIPELETYNVAAEVSYDAWNYSDTLLKYEVKHFKYNEFDIYFEYDSVCATISEKQVWIKITPYDTFDVLGDVFLCDFIDFKDDDWYVQSPIDTNNSEISHPIVLTDSMIKSIFEKVKSYGI